MLVYKSIGPRKASENLKKSKNKKVDAGGEAARKLCFKVNMELISETARRCE